MAKTKTSQKPSETSKEVLWPTVSTKEWLETEELEKDQIVLVADFLDAAECKAFATFVEAQALTTTGPPKRGEATRVNDRISIPSPSFAAALYTALQPHIADIPSFQTHLSPPAKPCGLNPNIRLYRYGSGQYFGPHYDDSVSYTEQDATGKSRAVWSEWTLLVYLTGEEDGVEGGETIFYKPAPKKKATPPPIVPPLRKGMALLHRHGKECMLHEGALVKAGTKLVLRSDLIFSQ